MSTHRYPLTIYYDASCPLCVHEMSLLMRYDHQEQLLLIDCSPLTFVSEGGYSRAEMMALIHARDADGRWLIGVPVFEAAYQACGFAVIAKILGAPFWQPIWQRLYPVVARHRLLLSRLGSGVVLSWMLGWLYRRAAARAQALPTCTSQATCPNSTPDSGDAPVTKRK